MLFITPVLFLAITCQNICGEKKVCRLPVFSSSLPLSSNGKRVGVWTPEVRWLHPQVICTALLFLKKKKKSPQWRHQRDNPAMSQIFVGTEPPMGARNEI